jgi:uncharacterized membrane protein
MNHPGRVLAPVACILLAACSGGTGSPSPAPSSSPTVAPSATPTVATAADTARYSGIAPDEKVHFTGTEPFWGGEVSDGVLTYTTPENQAGEMVAVDRLDGRNGISFSGELADMPFVLAVTPGQCSDGMSDRSYPFTATLQVKGELRKGCAWTDKQAFTGPKQP